MLTSPFVISFTLSYAVSMPGSQAEQYKRLSPTLGRKPSLALNPFAPPISLLIYRISIYEVYRGSIYMSIAL